MKSSSFGRRSQLAAFSIQGWRGGEPQSGGGGFLRGNSGTLRRGMFSSALLGRRSAEPNRGSERHGQSGGGGVRIYKRGVARLSRETVAIFGQCFRSTALIKARVCPQIYSFLLVQVFQCDGRGSGGPRIRVSSPTPSLAFRARSIFLFHF